MKLGRTIRWSVAIVVVLLLALAVLFIANTHFNFGARTFHFAAQRLAPDDLLRQQGFIVRSSWDGPTGEFERGETYGVQAWGWCLSCEVLFDPLGAARRNLPSSPEALAKLARSSNQWTKMAACERLASMGSAAAPALPLLVKQMLSGDESPQDAIRAICKSTPESSARLIAEAAMGGAVTSRCNLIVILSEVGPPANTAAPALTKLLRDAEPFVVTFSAYTLAKLGEPTAACVDAIAPLLTNMNAEVRASAVSVLAELGAPANKLESQIIRLLHDSHPDVRAMAARSLAAERRAARATNAFDDATLLRLAELAGTKTNNIADQWAMDALSTAGPPGAKILGRLYKASDERSFALTHAFVRFGPDAVSELPLFIEELERGSSARAMWAARIIGSMGSAATNALLQIVAALNHQSVYVRVHAAEAHFRITGQTNVALPVLIAALKEERSNGPLFAAEALERLGRAASGAEPELVLLLNSPRENFRRAAQKALDSIARSRE